MLEYKLIFIIIICILLTIGLIFAFLVANKFDKLEEMERIEVIATIKIN